MPSNPTTVLASSTGTYTVALDWMTGGITTVRLTSPSTVTPATGGTLRVTLHDISRTPSTGVKWTPLSSHGEAAWVSTGSTAVTTGTIFTASALIDTQQILKFTTPLGGLQFNCTGFSSGGLLIDVLQGRA
jgi:hypothetical protein